MKVSRKWLQEYIDGTLPEARELAEVLSLHAFEVEGIEQKGDDDVIDIDVLPNRAHDCLGHLGVARECAALLKLEYKAPDVSVETDGGVRTADELKLTVEDGALVPRATKRLATDVKVGESPDWLKERLAIVGQKSINNIVDITNFVMLETGQPVHAFDRDKIKGTITIRSAKKGEKIETLDGDTFELEEGMLVIADDDPSSPSGQGKPLDIAGIKGGANSGIDENTTQIVISICNFNPNSIRKTSRTLGLITDASKRFGQGLSLELLAMAMERTSQLIAELAGARIAEDILDEYPHPPHPYKVGMSVKEANKLLGLTLSENDVTDVFDRLGFSYERITNPREHIVEMAQKLEGVPYTYGASIVYDAPEHFDCSSFTAYLYAQAGIGIPRMTVDQLVFGEEITESELEPGDLVFSLNDTGDKETTIHEASKEFLQGTSVPEKVNHNGIYLGNGKVIHASGKWHKGQVVVEALKESPAFKELRGFRRVPAASGERFVVTAPHERLDLRIKQDLIEEVGRMYGYSNIKATVPEVRKEPEVSKEFYYINKIRDILVSEGFSEVYTYTFAENGDMEVLKPVNKEKPFLRTSLKENLASTAEQNSKNLPLLGAEEVNVFEIGSVFSGGEEHLSLALSGKRMEQAFEKLSDELGVDVKARDGEVNLGELIEKLPGPKSYDDLAELDSGGVAFKEISQYPFVARDIALWCSQQVENQEVRKVIEENAGNLLVRLDLFDTFQKDERVSYAFRLVFQSHERTLTDEEVNEVMDTIYKAVEEKGWEVR